MRLRRNLVVNIVVLTSFLVQVNDAQFTNQWAVDIDGGHSEADKVAKQPKRQVALIRVGHNLFLRFIYF